MDRTDIQNITSDGNTIYIVLKHTRNNLWDRSYARPQNKSNLDKFKKFEIISSIFSDHNGKKLEIGYKKETGKFTDMWR